MWNIQIFFYNLLSVKVQHEIDDLLQSQRLPGIEDRLQLPYTNAVIHEIQRVLDLAPTALFHAVTKDIQFRGYTLPKVPDYSDKERWWKARRHYSL